MVPDTNIFRVENDSFILFRPQHVMVRFATKSDSGFVWLGCVGLGYPVGKTRCLFYFPRQLYLAQGTVQKIKRNAGLDSGVCDDAVCIKARMR